MASPPVLTVRVIIQNEDGLHAFREGLEAVREAAEELTWRDDLREAVELLTRAAMQLEVVRDER